MTLGSRLRHALKALALIGALPGTAMAQESYTTYGQARGWTVETITVNGDYFRCAGGFPGTTAALELSDEGWTLTNYGNSTADRVPGILDIDRYSFQGDFFRLSNGRHAMFLDPSQIDLLRNGSYAAMEMGGLRTELPLTGSAAAMLKIEECHDRRGGQPQVAVPVPPAVDDDAQRMGAGCPAWGTIASLPSTQAVTASFINQSDRALNIYWIGFDGAMQEYAGLLPGERFDVTTYIGHYWLAKDFDFTCHGGVLAPMPGNASFALH